MTLIQPTQSNPKRVTINGVDAYDGTNPFHVHELRVYEDICKAYLTGQLIIETSVNFYETFLIPTAPVELWFEAPRSDGGKTREYREKFKIYSYDSKPYMGGDGVNRLQHTIQLIGEEFYNDRHNTVLQNFSNITGTQAARTIHNQYVTPKDGGVLTILESVGAIGKDQYPYQVRNMKPIKAIHDILDRVIYSNYKSGAVVYFRDKKMPYIPSYSAGPLQYFMEKSQISESFIHHPAAASDLGSVLQGYNIAHSMRPVVPPGETHASLGDMSGLIKKSFTMDVFSGKYAGTDSSIKKMLGILKNGKIGGNLVSGYLNAQKGLVKTTYGGRAAFNTFNENHQSKSVDKFATGRNLTEEAFITLLTLTQKYRVAVPLQTGINVTCGTRIRLTYPINDKLTVKTLFVPRLIHEIRWTHGKERRPYVAQGTTEMYCVAWE